MSPCSLVVFQLVHHTRQGRGDVLCEFLVEMPQTFLSANSQRESLAYSCKRTSGFSSLTPDLMFSQLLCDPHMEASVGRVLVFKHDGDTFFSRPAESHHRHSTRKSLHHLPSYNSPLTVPKFASIVGGFGTQSL